MVLVTISFEHPSTPFRFYRLIAPNANFQSAKLANIISGIITNVL